MFKNFTAKELFGALCCPFLAFLWGIVRWLNDLSLGEQFLGRGIFRVTYFLAMFSGILTAILTLKLNLHTERYLKKRLIIIAAVIVMTGFINGNGHVGVMITLDLLVYVGAVVLQILTVQDQNTFGAERAVLMLSDPVVYLGIRDFLLWFTTLLEM